MCTFLVGSLVSKIEYSIKGHFVEIDINQSKNSKKIKRRKKRDLLT